MPNDAPRGPAVLVEDLSKTFRLPHEQVHTFKERALHPFRGRGTDVLAALSGISFAVDHGEFFGIVGRNGSGKSTLLKCLAGIYALDAGRVSVDGRVSTFIELGVGFNPDLAARDNAVLNSIMLGLSRRAALERYDRIIDFAELREFTDLKIKNYSSGMLVRLAFAVMIQVDADILLIDEVLAVGDAAFQQKCFDEFNRLREERRTILFVTHDMDAVNRYCDRAMLLERGDMVALDTAETIGHRYFEINFGRGDEGLTQFDASRQGDGHAEIEDAWFEGESGERTGTLELGRACSAHFTVTFHKDVTDPVLAIAITDEEHRILFATSNMWVEEPTGQFRAGDQTTLSVAFDNVLSPGRYYITPSVAYAGGGNDFLDRRDRVSSVIVTGLRAGGGMVDLPHDVRVRRGSPDQAPTG